MPARNNRTTVNSRTLRGRRGCLVWFSWLIVIRAIAAGGYYFRDEVPPVIDVVISQLNLATPAPTPVPAPDYAALIQDFRRRTGGGAERAWSRPLTTS
ncbi:MAG: hypothetical protein IPK16_30375 [Anaerolineales bacterium]|nr:hypothetical protein [Anaerolineales bacterium]